MTNDVPDARGYSFGAFTLDTGRGALFRGGREITLRPKSYEVLHYLVRHPQRLVSREALLRAAWPDVVVTDDSLTQCLIEIRKALGDESKEIVRTVPRRGYLFEPPVRTIGAQETGSPLPARAGAAPRAPSRWTLAGLLLLAVAVAATWWRAGDVPGSAGDAPPHRPQPDSVAVLPFVDMSPHGDQEYLADGVAEEILNLLAQVRGLKVIARTSSFSFKGERVDIGTIARRLDVAYVLEGSVRKAGDRVRITAQLVDGESGAHVWSETYERKLDDVFATQDEIAHDVAAVLRTQLLGESGTVIAFGGGPAHGPDPRAWELYLRGRYLYGRRMTGDRLQAQRYFEQALEIDAGVAAAWVSLAATYNIRMGDPNLSDEERLSRETGLPLMRQALEQALSLDPHNPEALFRMAGFSWREGDSEAAFAQIEQAMRLGRNHPIVQSLLGGQAYAMGDPGLAAELQRRAIALDPLSATHLGNYGHFLYSAGRLGEAGAALREAAMLNPEYARQNLDFRVRIAILRGDFGKAEGLARSLPPGPAADRAQAMLAFHAGDRATSDAALARLKASKGPEALLGLVDVLAFRGETAGALEAADAALKRLSAQPDRSDARHLSVALRSSPFLKIQVTDESWQRVDDAIRRLRYPEHERTLVLLRDYVQSDTGI